MVGHSHSVGFEGWIPAFAGMTDGGGLRKGRRWVGKPEAAPSGRPRACRRAPSLSLPHRGRGRKAGWIPASAGMTDGGGLRKGRRWVGKPEEAPFWAPARLSARALSQSPPQGERPEGGMDSRFRGNDGWGRVAQGVTVGWGSRRRRPPGARAPADARPLSVSPTAGGKGAHKGRPTGGMDSRFRGNDGWGRVAQGSPLGGEAGGGALWAPARLSARALSQSPPQPEGRAPTRGAPTGGMDSRFLGNDGWGRVAQGLPLDEGAGGGALRAPARLSAARPLSVSPTGGEAGGKGAHKGRPYGRDGFPLSRE